MPHAYHRTTAEAADAILRNGFRDAEGAYMTAGIHGGVWVTIDRPWDHATGGTPDEALLVIDIPTEALTPHEWIEEGKPYREMLVPAEVLNRYPVWEAWECDECGTIQPAVTKGWSREMTRPFSALVTLCSACRQRLGH